jgi:hypothetical protein
MVRNGRNQYGVKDQIDCYRTIKCEHFIAWISYPSSERIKAYRTAGVKCRRYGDELYIRAADKQRAIDVDDAVDVGSSA